MALLTSSHKAIAALPPPWRPGLALCSVRMSVGCSGSPWSWSWTNHIVGVSAMRRVANKRFVTACRRSCWKADVMSECTPKWLTWAKGHMAVQLAVWP
eukprot:4683625-Amphidinium_carterae.1